MTEKPSVEPTTTPGPVAPSPAESEGDDIAAGADREAEGGIDLLWLLLLLGVVVIVVRVVRNLQLEHNKE